MPFKFFLVSNLVICTGNAFVSIHNSLKTKKKKVGKKSGESSQKSFSREFSPFFSEQVFYFNRAANKETIF